MYENTAVAVPSDIDDAGEAKFELVHGDALQCFPELVKELGGDPLAILREARIDPSILGSKDAGFEYRSFIHVLELAAERLASPDFGMKLAILQGCNRAIGPIGVVMKNSETLGQALGYCAKHIHAYSLATRVRFKPNREKHILFVGLEILLEGVPEKAQVVEHALLLANKNILEITGGNACVRSVSFRHEPQMPLSMYREYFNCEVLFEQEYDGIVVTEQDLLCPVIHADEQIYMMATSYIDTHYPEAIPQLQARVHAWISEHIASEECTYEKLADEFCMHPRTLQRRLKGAGKSFKGIKDDVRREIAEHLLLKTELSLGRISERLGYADASVFSRCCYRWFGTSPGQLRDERHGRPACQVSENVPCMAG